MKNKILQFLDKSISNIFKSISEFYCTIKVFNNYIYAYDLCKYRKKNEVKEIMKYYSDNTLKVLSEIPNVMKEVFNG